MRLPEKLAHSKTWTENIQDENGTSSRLENEDVSKLKAKPQID